MAAGFELYTTIAITGGASNCVSALPSSAHVDDTRLAAQRRRCCNSGISRPALFNSKSPAGGQLQPAAHFAPGADQRRQRRNSPRGRSPAIAALNAVVQADRRRPGGGVFARQRYHVLARNAGQRLHALRRILARQFGQRIKPVGVIATYSASCSFSPMITCISPSASARSLPG